MSNSWKFVAPLLVITVLCGCGDRGSGLAPVTGVVLLDDKPMTTGVVITSPQRGRSARGEIDSEGRFTLNSGDLGAGASIGRHGVAVVAVEALPATGEINPEAPRKLLVPRKYADPGTSELSIDVQPGQTNEVTLKLSSNQ